MGEIDDSRVTQAGVILAPVDDGHGALVLTAQEMFGHNGVAGQQHQCYPCGGQPLDAIKAPDMPAQTPASSRLAANNSGSSERMNGQVLFESSAEAKAAAATRSSEISTISYSLHTDFAAISVHGHGFEARRRTRDAKCTGEIELCEDTLRRKRQLCKERVQPSRKHTIIDDAAVDHACNDRRPW